MNAFLIAAALMLVPLQTTPQRVNGVIQGTVTQFGQSIPLPNVEISLRSATEGYFLNASPDTVTDEKGRFEIRDVIPGKYVLHASRPGYVNPAINGVRLKDGGEDRAVTVAPGQLAQNADLTLIRGAVVAGRVVDPDGRPVVDMGVDARFVAPSAQNLDGVPYWLGKGTTTDDRGEYRIIGLEPGRYAIAASNDHRPETPDFAKTYFPDAIDESKATVVTLGVAEVRERLDITLQPVAKTKPFKVSGRIVSPTRAYTENSGITQIYLIPADSPAPDSSRETLLFNESDADAEPNQIPFEVKARPGRYDLYIQVNTDIRKSDIDSDEGVAGKTTITVRDEDIEGISITAGGVDLQGQAFVKDENLGKLNGYARLTLAAEKLPSQPGKPNEDGSFAIRAVIPGVWKAEWVSPQKDLVVVDVRQRGESVFENGFAVGDRSPEPIQMTLSRVGTIEGLVRDGQPQTVAGAEIVLLPSSPGEGNSALIRRTSADAAGHFTLKTVAVGEYRLYALNVLEFPADVIPQDPVALRAFLAPLAGEAKAVIVAAGTTAGVTVNLLKRN